MYLAYYIYHKMYYIYHSSIGEFPLLRYPVLKRMIKHIIYNNQLLKNFFDNRSRLKSLGKYAENG